MNKFKFFDKNQVFVLGDEIPCTGLFEPTFCFNNGTATEIAKVLVLFEMIPAKALGDICSNRVGRSAQLFTNCVL